MALEIPTIANFRFEEEASGLNRQSIYDKTGGIDRVLSLHPQSGQRGLSGFYGDFPALTTKNDVANK
jgi:hypothetical protein